VKPVAGQRNSARLTSRDSSIH